MNPFRTAAIVTPSKEEEPVIMREAKWECAGGRLQLRWVEGSRHVEIGMPAQGAPGGVDWLRLPFDEAKTLYAVLKVAISEATREART